ncbi:hypothetical protein [Croceivirga sp. JEA036]|uniref:hypothetical protein n=1 Tax=Croceivirga sp. JEA036 TaxID=2721162 RepID=UPI001438E632|nr:hypothetical protein [Croceivirga sp. JEA036]NJB35070.1 hypothetical protein [Croceivirga sp. JEA036]
MNMKFALAFAFLLQISILEAQESVLSLPLLEEQHFFEEKDGMVAVEAEFYYKQQKSDTRQWYRFNKHESANTNKENHSLGTGNNGYIQLLPDTRVTHVDRLIKGENFSNEAGALGIVTYRVKINTPGRYYVWSRAFSSGSEDNSVHVGINGQWPEHGQRMQWCDGKNQWTWASKQRTKEEHCGVSNEIYLDIPAAGYHNIEFSMREDGFAMDRFLLTTDKDFVPSEIGPPARIKWPEPSYYETISTSVIENKTLPVADFPMQNTGFYKDAGGRWFAINPNKNKEASTSVDFNFKSGLYDVVFVGVGENDGQSEFTVLINDKELGTFSPKLSQKLFFEGNGSNKVWEKVNLQTGDRITVKAKIGSKDGNEWARARWSGLIFAPVGRGILVSNAPGILVSGNTNPPSINPPKGRIAIVADGNSPDPDDLGGTAVSLSLLRAAGLEDRLVHYSHSCDLVRVERISERAERERHALMQSACDVTARRWGGFDDLTFFDAKWQQEKTVADLANAINASSADDPLWIVEAGEPDIIGLALDASNKAKHPYVKVVTHHPANDDAGDFYSWQQILDYGVEEVRIPDQNVNLKVNIENWDWAKNHPDPRVQWVWLQGKIAEVDDVVRFQKGKWDCSDAGMVLYWITGATNGGLRLGTVADVKHILLSSIENK